MKALEWLRVLVTLGATAAEVVRERRLRGDTRPAREIWREVKTQRAAREAIQRQRERLGLPERDDD